MHGLWGKTKSMTMTKDLEAKTKSPIMLYDVAFVVLMSLCCSSKAFYIRFARPVCTLNHSLAEPI